jgi:hypothetical protein
MVCDHLTVELAVVFSCWNPTIIGVMGPDKFSQELVTECISVKIVSVGFGCMRFKSVTETVMIDPIIITVVG